MRVLTAGVPYPRLMRLWPRALRFDPDPVAVQLPEPLAREVSTLLARDDFAGAVALVRRRTGINLQPAVRAVEALRSR